MLSFIRPSITFFSNESWRNIVPTIFLSFLVSIADKYLNSLIWSREGH